MTSTLAYRSAEGYESSTVGTSRFTSLAGHGTLADVINSYLGIITPRGLETLVVETEHAAPFLLRRVSRQPLGELVACWAVLDETEAREVARHVAGRRFQEALCQLNALAIDLGTVLPPESEEDVWRHGP